MPKELRELLAKIQNKKAAARELLAQKSWKKRSNLQMKLRIYRRSSISLQLCMKKK